MEIKTIEKEYSATLIIDKSKFFSFIIPINNKEEAITIINEYKKKYYDATHVCYGYSLFVDNNTIYKSNDDGEPSSTAGVPILNAIKEQNLNNVLVIVVRYFGGIKLGAGNLTRTYHEVAKMAINEANIITLKECNVYELTFPYNLVTIMDINLKNINAIILDKKYELEVIYQISLIDETLINILKEKVPVNLKINLMGSKIIKY